MDPKSIQAFQAKVWGFYRDNRRDFAWRNDPMPYEVFISEVMLQQTQVRRVADRFPLWLRRFPGFSALASAGVKDVLEEWNGLGYNRRALRLRDSARLIMAEFAGQLPSEPSVLMSLPGIGANTAGSLAAFAYNRPVVFIETNIRRVFIHEFFSETSKVHDKELLPLIESTLDHEEPREWYYALMDRGADIARRVPNPNRQSRHYSVQSRFEGSSRQIRGEVLRRLGDQDLTLSDLGIEDKRLPEILDSLIKEGFLSKSGEYYGLMK
jgi:A/G-specific adenine glycosylase